MQRRRPWGNLSDGVALAETWKRRASHVDNQGQAGQGENSLLRWVWPMGFSEAPRGGGHGWGGGTRDEGEELAVEWCMLTSAVGQCKDFSFGRVAQEII